MFGLVLLSAVVVLGHPQKQWRFLATWMFGVWIGSGVGAAALLQMLMSARYVRLRAAAAMSSFVLLAAAMTAAQPSPRADHYALQKSSGPSDLAFAHAYLAHVHPRKGLAIAATMGPTDLWTWTAREHCRCLARIERPFFEFRPAREDVARKMSALVASAKVDTLILIDAPAYPVPGVLGFSYDRMRGLLDAMAEQDRFERIAIIPVPEHRATVTIWRRKSSSIARPPA